MRTSLALSFASVVILAFASGCGHDASDEQPAPGADDVAANNGSTPADPATPGAKSGDAKTTGGAGVTVVRGKLAESTIALDNTRALAIAEDQTTYWSFLDHDGEFTLEVPVGASYRIVFVNQLVGGGQVKIGHVSFESGSGSSQWFGASSAGELDLGKVSATTEAKTLAPESTPDSMPDHSDDPSSSMDDSRDADGPKVEDAASVKIDAINVCLIWPSVELHAGVEVGSSWASLTPHADDAERDDDKTCASWTGNAGAIVWGAPWSFQANGQIVIAGGFQVQGGISGSLYGGYSSSYSASWSSSAFYSGGFSGGYSGSISGNINGNINGGFNGGFNSSFSGGFSGSVSGSISGGWAVSGGFSGGFSGSVQGGVCVNAQACDKAFSCVASKCEKK